MDCDTHRHKVAGVVSFFGEQTVHVCSELVLGEKHVPSVLKHVVIHDKVEKRAGKDHLFIKDSIRASHGMIGPYFEEGRCVCVRV